MAVDGAGLGAVLAGSVFLYAGIRGKTVLGSLQAVVQGKSPSTAAAANQIGPGDSAGTPGGTSGNSGAAPSTSNAQQALQQAAAQFGWGSGAEWQALQHVEMQEAGFNIHAKNPSSGAYGMAQFINGPSEYYTYGGNPDTAGGQAIAMCNYIKQRYGDPIAAWAHEQSAGWY